jgi:hypothetical protein
MLRTANEPLTTWRSYWRAVLSHAGTTTWGLVKSKLAFSVYMPALVAAFAAWYAADVALPYSLPLAVVAVLSAALVTLALFLVGSLLAAPYQIHGEQVQAADVAAQACAERIAALEARVERRADRDALGRFLVEGTALQARILAKASSPAEVQDWLNRVSTPVRDTRGDADLARLVSDAGLSPRTPMDPDPGGPTGWRLIRDGRDSLWRVVHGQCTRLQEFLAEDPRA